MGNTGTKLNQKWIEQRDYEVIKERNDQVFGLCTIVRFNQLQQSNPFYLIKTIDPSSFESLHFSNEKL